MHQRLILLTNYFPFAKGEEYLESEIPHLASRFADIVVVPLMTMPGMHQTRSVPPGVRVVDPQAGLGLPGRFTSLARQSVRRNRGWDALPRGRAGVLRHPVHTAFDVYFESRAAAVLERVLAIENRIRPTYGQDVTIYSYWFYLTARVGAALKQRWAPEHAVTLVSRGHGYDVNLAASAVHYLPVREFLLDQVDRLHPVSDAITNYFQRTYPRYAHKVSTRRLGSLAHETPLMASRGALRLVSVSTIRPLKRIELIADAVEQIRVKYPTLSWTHIGTGESRYADEVRASIKQRFPEGVVELPGHLDNSAVHEWYQRNPATVFLNVSTSEGVPVSIMEAMSYGLPVIATDVGGTSELFSRDMFPGLLKADADGQDVAERVDALLTQPESTYTVQALAAREAWRSMWNSQRNFQDFARELVAI